MAGWKRWAALRWLPPQRYPMLQDTDNDCVPEPPDRVEVYEFAPKGGVRQYFMVLPVFNTRNRKNSQGSPAFGGSCRVGTG